MKLEDVRVGSKVLVSGAWGTQDAVTATVTMVCEDVKNGVPGIDYTVDNTEVQKWAYLYQVQSVLEY